MKTLILLAALINPALKQETVKINKTYEISDPSSLIVLIDNINGSVEVEPSNDNMVYLSLEIVIDADSDSQMAKAKRELKLGERFTNDSLKFFMDAPFIERCWGGFNIREELEYSFKYEYKIKMPVNASVYAKTVNRGNVLVADIKGPVKASNVNGKVDIVNAMKVEKASTVNGDVTINFIETPKESVAFKTVNGDFNFELPDDFSAKVFFNSMNGDLYTAFDYTHLSPQVERSEKGGKFKIGTKSGVEIGSGGPELSFKSINGNVYLKKSSK